MLVREEGEIFVKTKDSPGKRGMKAVEEGERRAKGGRADREEAAERRIKGWREKMKRS